MNKFIGMGRLTRDPEITTTNTGTQMARYSIAVDRKFKKEGQPTADFFNCVSFGKQAEFCEKYLKKGIKVVVSGPIQIDNYTTKTGEKRINVNVMVDDIEFAESKGDKTDNNESKNDFINVTIPMEELPFS